MSSRQPWTSVEDQILTSLVKKFGGGNWVLISQKMEAKANANTRTGKQCRQRWHNHLDPSVSKKSWTLQQQKTMFEAHKKYGNKWSDIANQLKGRTDSDVKNHFYSIIRKCLRRVSKMVGQKNSTQKIRNVKPSTLSKLLDKNDNPKSKYKNNNNLETSQALFKFILQRQNLNIKNLQKKNKQILQNLVERIVNMNQEKQQEVNVSVSEDLQKQQRKQRQCTKVVELRHSSRNLKSLKSIKSDQEVFNLPQINNKKKISKTKKIKKQVSFQPQKKQSIKITTQKQNNYDQIKQIKDSQFQIPLIMKNQFKLSSIMGEIPLQGFRFVQDIKSSKSQLKKRSSAGRQSMTSERSLFNQILIPESLSIRRRSSSGLSEMRGIMSNTDHRSIYVTPSQPSPGYGQNLFPTWALPIKITKQSIDEQTLKIKKEIQRNIQQTKY